MKWAVRYTLTYSRYSCDRRIIQVQPFDFWRWATFGNAINVIVNDICEFQMMRWLGGECRPLNIEWISRDTIYMENENKKETTRIIANLILVELDNMELARKKVC